MRRVVKLTLCALPALVAACGGRGDGIAFRSEKERACHARAQAEITDRNTTLQRAQAGNFVLVTRVEGFVRNIEVSDTFETCMAEVENLPPAVAEGQPITLTPQDQAIWNGLTDDQKRRAVIFIQQGGTLDDFVAS